MGRNGEVGRMKVKIKKEWTKKLRSKKFKQTEGHLHDDYGYCCLGVLRTCLPKKFQNAESNRNPETLPREVLDYCGIHHNTQERLVEMNDGGVNFTDIADYIERRL